MKKCKRVRILTATSSFQVEWSNWGSYRKTAHFSFKWAKPTLRHSVYTVLPIFFFFYFTMLPIAQFSAAKVWIWIIIKKKVCVWGGGGGGGVVGSIVIYNPNDFFLFHYVTNSTVFCCKSVNLNNNNKKKVCVCVCVWGGGSIVI